MMFLIFFYISLICLALMGALAIACFVIALWMIAIIVDLFVLGYRLLDGQRGAQLWRDPFSKRILVKTGTATRTTQAASSNGDGMLCGGGDTSIAGGGGL
jgi:hypothetical protein